MSAIERIKQIRAATGAALKEAVAIQRGEDATNGADLVALFARATTDADEAFTRGKLEGYREGVEAVVRGLEAAGVDVVEAEGADA